MTAFVASSVARRRLSPQCSKPLDRSLIARELDVHALELAERRARLLRRDEVVLAHFAQLVLDAVTMSGELE